MTTESGERFWRGEDIEGPGIGEIHLREKEYTRYGRVAGTLHDIRSLLAKAANRLEEISKVIDKDRGALHIEDDNPRRPPGHPVS